jgi:VanZ family protein
MSVQLQTLPLKEIKKVIKKVGIILWFWTPVALWMGILYYSSSIPGSDLPKFNIPNIDKLFHSVEYLILGALIARAFANCSDKMSFKLILLLSILIASSYGVLDEFHQRFVSGRSPEIFDILSDIIGSLFGALLSIHKERGSRAVNKTV